MRPHLTYSRVVSTLALFVALGGTGYAAVSINGRNIADHSIAARKLARGAVVPRAARADALPGVTIRSAKVLVFQVGQAGSARVMCHRGEQVLGGGGSYDETVVPPTTEGQPFTSTGKEDVRDRLIGSRPVVEGTRHTSRLQPAERQYIGWPDSFEAGGSVTGLEGWSVQSIRGGDGAYLHVFALCARGRGIVPTFTVPF